MSRTDGKLLARWSGKLDGAVVSPLEFYQMVEAELAESELPNISFSYICRREGGLFSTKRIYLRIRYKRLFFDVGAFFVGNALVASWWLHEDFPGVADLFAEIPVIGFFIEHTSRTATYYSIDRIEFIQKSIHQAILNIVDRLSKENNVTVLPVQEREPVWEEIW